MSDTNTENDPVKQRLTQLNIDIGANEKKGKKSYFETALADEFIFRRANGDIVKKAGYLKGLEGVAGDPYEISETYVQEIVVDGATAVATVIVVVKRSSMDRVRPFRNMRLFRLDGGDWKLVAWINTRIGEIV